MANIVVNPELVYAGVADWEYGCCGEIPRVGLAVDWELWAYPVLSARTVVRVQPLSWDREHALIRFAGGSATWLEYRGDPFAQPVALGAGWHWHHDVAPVYVRGSIEEVHDGVDARDAEVVTGVLVGLRVDHIAVPGWQGVPNA